MFNIAIVSDTQNNASTYISALKEKEYTLRHMDLGELSKEISSIHAVFILEPAVETIGQTCEWIIKVRDIANCFIWVLSEEVTKINRIIHLQLGADGTFNNQTDLDEFSLYITKTLERRAGHGVNRFVDHSKEDKKSFDIHLVPANFAVKIEGKDEISLTKLEYKTL